MALTKQIQDKVGNDYQESYWNISDISFSIPSKTINVKFIAFKDKLAREEEKAAIPGEEKSYTIVGDSFNKIYDAIYPIIGPYFYEHAKNEKDISTPENNSDGTPVRVSFFEEAADELEVKITDKEIVFKPIEAEIAAGEAVEIKN